MVVVMNKSIKTEKSKTINVLINNFTRMDINEGQMNGGGIGIPLPSYLIAIVKKFEEGGQALNAVYEEGRHTLNSVYEEGRHTLNAVYVNIYTILEKGVELLQFLSGKNNCLEDYLKYLVGNNITKLIKYYLIGAIVISSNFLELVNVLLRILNMIRPIIPQIIGGTVSIIIGKYVSAITSYYLNQKGIEAADKARELQLKLNNFVNMSDDEAVNNIDNAAKEIRDLITTEFEPMTIMTKEEKKAFMDEVKEGLTQEQRNLLNNVGEFVDAESVKKMHEEMERENGGGGKRHRKTKKHHKKHHKKSQKKYRKKSHKRHHKKK